MTRLTPGDSSTDIKRSTAPAPSARKESISASDSLAMGNKRCLDPLMAPFRNPPKVNDIRGANIG